MLIDAAWASLSSMNSESMTTGPAFLLTTTLSVENFDPVPSAVRNRGDTCESKNCTVRALGMAREATGPVRDTESAAFAPHENPMRSCAPIRPVDGPPSEGPVDSR